MSYLQHFSWPDRSERKIFINSKNSAHFVAIPEGLARVFILLDFIKVCQAALEMS
jgi:hypothetical protein